MEDKMISPFLLGQLMATAHLIEKATNESFGATENTQTLSQENFIALLENPAATIARMETVLMPQKKLFADTVDMKLINDMKLIYKIKNQYILPDTPVEDKEAYYQGYESQMKKYNSN